MFKFSRILLSGIVLAIFVGTFGAIETQAQVIGEILKRMEAHANALDTLRAKVSMTKHNVQLDDSDLQRGTAVLVPGDKKTTKIRIDWTEPFEETFIVAKGRYVIYQPTLKQAITGKASNAGKDTKSANAFAVLDMSKIELKANYKIIYLGIEKIGGVDMWRLRLNPKSETSYDHTEVWVDGNGMPIQNKIYEKNGDSTTIRLTAIEKNIRVNLKVFKINLPKNVKIIKR